MSDGLINTLESPGEFDALTALRPDEPYFLLLGRDRLAPDLVQKWADDNRRRALAESDEGKIDDGKRERELRKSTDAEAIGWSMKAYKAGQLAKEVRERPVTYSGHELPEATKRSDAVQSARSRTASAINNAAAELNSLCGLLADGPIEDRAMADLYRLSLADIQALSDEIAPRRVIAQAPAPLLDAQPEESEDGNEEHPER